MTQISSLDESSPSSFVSPPHLVVPPVITSPTSHPQCIVHKDVEPPHTSATASPPPYTPGSTSHVSHNLAAGVSPKAAGKQATPQPRYSCCNFLSDTWTLVVSLAFITLVCTILIFVFSTVLTDIGAHLLSWDHHDEYLVVLTWSYTFAAIAIGSVVLGSILAFILFILGINAPNAIMNAPPQFILPPCALGGVFALPMGLTAFPGRVVPSVPFTWKDGLNTSAAGVVGFCLFILICMLALLVGALLLNTLPPRQLSSRAKNVRGSSSECAV